MAFFDDLGKKISQAGQAVSQKTKDITGVAKLNSAISDEQKNLQNIYYQIGRAYAFKHAQDCDEEFKQLIEQSIVSEQNIVAYQQQINNIKGVITCPNCNVQLPANTAFCNSCGTRIPPQQATVQPPADPNQLFCPNCGQPIGAGLKFCTACGTPAPEFPQQQAPVYEQPTPANEQPVPTPVASAAAFCPTCGSTVPDEMVFCQNCGTKIR